MTIEEDFQEMVEHLTFIGIENVQLFLKDAKIDRVPERFQRTLSFWKSLSGPSRNLMIDNAQGRRLRKKF